MVSEKKLKQGLRKCNGHVEKWLRNSKWRKGWSEEERSKHLEKDCYDLDGKCQICGGYKANVE